MLKPERAGTCCCSSYSEIAGFDFGPASFLPRRLPHQKAEKPARAIPATRDPATTPAIQAPGMEADVDDAWDAGSGAPVWMGPAGDGDPVDGGGIPIAPAVGVVTIISRYTSWAVHTLPHQIWSHFWSWTAGGYLSWMVIVKQFPQLELLFRCSLRVSRRCVAADRIGARPTHSRQF